MRDGALLQDQNLEAARSEVKPAQPGRSALAGGPARAPNHRELRPRWVPPRRAGRQAPPPPRSSRGRFQAPTGKGGGGPAGFPCTRRPPYPSWACLRERLGLLVAQAHPSPLPRQSVPLPLPHPAEAKTCAWNRGGAPGTQKRAGPLPPAEGLRRRPRAPDGLQEFLSQPLSGRRGDWVDPRTRRSKVEQRVSKLASLSVWGAGRDPDVQGCSSSPSLHVIVLGSLLLPSGRDT